MTVFSVLTLKIKKISNFISHGVKVKDLVIIVATIASLAEIRLKIIMPINL